MAKATYEIVKSLHSFVMRELGKLVVLSSLWANMSRRIEVVRPVLHQFAALREQRSAVVSCFNIGLRIVRQRKVGDFGRIACFVGYPRSERRSEPVRRVRDFKRLTKDHFRERLITVGLTGINIWKYPTVAAVEHVRLVQQR